MSLEKWKGGISGWKDIIETRLAHLNIRLDSPGAYQWDAQTQIDQWIFVGHGFTPGAAVEALYSHMIRHFDQRSDKLGEFGEIT